MPTTRRLRPHFFPYLLITCSVIGLSAAMGGDNASSPQAPSSLQSLPAYSQTVAWNQSKTLSYAGAQLEVGAGAVPQGQKITIGITPLGITSLPVMKKEMTDATKTYAGYEFTPHGTKFAKNITVSLPYDATQLLPGQTEDDLYTFYFDDLTASWIALERVKVDKQKGVVVSYTDHFTDMINATVVVPDHPTPTSFDPNSMKDITAANPAAGINLIQPPQASNTGDAKLSYAIEVPPGRVSLQPELVIQYSSSGGNGWVGIGWDLSVDNITIDTRWGVPRYDAANETETYVLNGEQLTPLAHRGALQARTAEKVFHTRVESLFRKIIRHGDGPTNYWWETIDKNGTRRFFGGDPETNGPAPDAVLAAGAGGNICRWALRRVQDTSANRIDYAYEVAVNSGLPGGTVPGRQLYLKSIHYTGLGPDLGPYSVEFARDSARADVMIDCRPGFKTVTADRLAQIEVRYKGDLIRRYQFEYQEGAFRKSLLKSISQFGENGEFFNKHEFEYYDDVRDSSGLHAGFSPAAGWSVQDDGISAAFFGGHASALGGFSSSSISGHLYVGFNPCSPTKQFSFGGKGGFNVTESEEVLAFIDLDGDGLPDKVFKSGDTIYYRKNLSGPRGPHAFSGGSPQPIDTLGKLSEENSDSFNFGGEAYVLFASAFANTSDTTTTSSVYFSDVNGDGLPDLVDNGQVWFNHLESGVPTFTLDSLDTPVPVDNSGSAQVGSLIEDFTALLNQRIDNNPLLDPLRRWQAPFDGQIKITAPVQLIQDTSVKRAKYLFADGVRVAIQKNGGELWSDTIGPDDYGVHTPSGVDAINVVKGDRIYFRVQSVFDGAYDQVEWNPAIDYVGVTATTDVNLLNPYAFSAKNDFTLAGRGGRLGVPFNGTMRVVGNPKKTGKTTDSVTFLIRKYGKSGDPAEIVFSHTMNWDETGEVTLSQDFAVIGPGNCVESGTGNPCPGGAATCVCQGGVNDGEACGDEGCPGNQLEFYIQVDSPIDLAQIEWKPETFYVDAPGHVVTDPNTGDFVIRSKPVPDIDLYPEDELAAPQAAWTVPAHDGSILVFADLTIDPLLPPFDAALVLTVKRRGESVAKGQITITNSILSGDLNLSIDAAEGDELFFDYSTRNGRAEYCQNPDPGLASKLTHKSVVVLYFPPGSVFADIIQVPSDFHSSVSLDTSFFNESYRGWSFVAYDGNRDRATHPIDEALLQVDYCQLQSDAEAAQANGTYSFFKEKSLPFLPLENSPDLWGGQDDHCWVAAEQMSSSRLGADHIEVPQAGNIASGRGVERISVGGQDSVGLGVGILSGSRSCGASNAKLDFMDMNGDGFPDIVGISSIQYTTMIGGLSDPAAVPKLNGIRDNTNEAQNAGVGFGVGGNPAKSKENAKGNVSPSGENSNTTGEQGSQMPTLGFSGTLGCGLSKTNFDLIDVNGDGLPDRVRNEYFSCSLIPGLELCPSAEGQWLIYVALNLGYGFADEELWGAATVNEGLNNSFDLGVSAGFNDGIYGYGGGVSIAESDSWTDRGLADVNGDGLLDTVRSSGNNLYVGFNTGNGFASEVLWADVAQQHMSANASVNQGLGGYVTIAVGGWCFGCCYIIINPGLDAGIDSMSRPSVLLRDINGDGYPDHLRSDEEGNLSVALNRTDRTNLLRKITRPLGAVITLDYARDGNTYDMPQSRWVLNRVEVNDGFPGDGVDTHVTTYGYSGGLYNRNEREFYGYRSVVEEQRDAGHADALYRTTTRTFHVDGFYSKGLLESQVLTDSAGNKFTEEIHTYALVDVFSGLPADPNSTTATVFPQPVRTDKLFYEGQAVPGKSTYTTQKYDALGNVTEFFDAADAGTQDDVLATIGYFSDPANYIVGLPNSIVVTSNGVELRHREGTIEAGSGDLRQVRQFLANGQAAVTDLDYFPNGNLQRVTGPLNQTGQRYVIEMTYDPDVQTHIASIKDSFGYQSTATYNLKYGREAVITDLNGNQTDHDYDQFGRVLAITGPYELGTGYHTLEFAYNHGAAVPWARTRHIDVFRNPADPIETVLFIDGLTHVLQTKKDAAVHTGPDTPSQDVMTVSGRITFDFLGRPIERFYPITEPLGTAGVFNPTYDSVAPTRTEHDVLDRVTRLTIPDGTFSTNAYGFGPDRSGATQFETVVVDANGIQKRVYRDVRELIVGILDFNKGGAEQIWTSYVHDPMKQLALVEDDRHNLTRLAYDNFGRLIVNDSPDAGKTESQYDLAGNLVAKVTANLRAKGQSITYLYDFNRLTIIRYPSSPQINVDYTYGLPGAGDNRAGRIATIKSQGGTEERFYGKLGEVIREVKTIASFTQGNGAVLPPVYTTQFTYDTWGRLQQMIYPDNEVLTYRYDSGGLLASGAGLKGGFQVDYIKRLEYDKFEERAFLEVYNGIRTAYSYDPQNRRLSHLQAGKVGSDPFQNVLYTYDKVGNVLAVFNSVAVPPPNQFGGPVQQQYVYDDLYRLVQASGSYQYSPQKLDRYSFEMSYDTIDNVLSKHQLHEIVQPGGQAIAQHDTTYAWDYLYAGTQPHASTHIGDRTYSYDANGNQAGWDADRNGTRRTITWDDANRIQTIADNGHTKYYKYNDTDERIMKVGPQGETVYVNSYFTVRNGTIGTKHIYAGATRVSSKLSPNFSKPPTDAGRPEINFLYFYHPDHLRSTSYVTDNTGGLYEHVQYFPFGETWVDEDSNTQRTPYLFTSKELDEETGLYYFGGRYQDPQIGTFLSTDPANAERGKQVKQLMEPRNLNLYAYTQHNPVTFTDPDGRELRVAKDASAQFKADYQKSIAYLKRADKRLGNIITRLEKDKRSIIIKEGNVTAFTIAPENERKTENVYGTITFDPKQGLVIPGEGIQSAALGLYHELGHAFDALTDPKLVGKLTEQQTVDKFETPAAKILGEPVRKKYEQGRPVTLEPKKGPTYHKKGQPDL